MTLTQKQLLERLKNSQGTVIVGIEAITDARANKTGNPHGKILKHVRAVGIVGADYQTSVNNEALRQNGKPVFKAEKLPWGEWLVNGKVIQHNGRLYMRTQCTPGQRRKQPAKVLSYRDENGKFISKDEAMKFVPVRQESTKQQNKTGIEKTLWVSTYAFDSIKKVRIGGQTYELTK
jgi:hypothetical protein